MASKEIDSDFTAIDPLIKVAGTKQMLKVCTTTVYKLVKQGKLTPIKLGPRCTRFRLSEIEALIDAHTVAGGAK